MHTSYHIGAEARETVAEALEAMAASIRKGAKSAAFSIGGTEETFGHTVRVFFHADRPASEGATAYAALHGFKGPMPRPSKLRTEDGDSFTLRNIRTADGEVALYDS